MTPPPIATALPSGLTRLDDWGVIRARGSDARRFLHGQLTQDVETLAPGQARLAGYCSAKGRLLASFVFWQHAPDELLLACSADVLPAALKRLSMYVLRAQCKLVDASAEFPLWGLAGTQTVPGLPPSVWDCTVLTDADIVRLPDAAAAAGGVARYLWAGEPPAGVPALDRDAWRWLEVASGVVRVVASTVEQFVPQTVNLELVGGVNFQKGCYPGQEIVARSQYRGTLKRRAFVLASAAALAPGQEVFHSADPEQPAGMVALAGTLVGQHAALVQLKTAALDGGTLHAGSAAGALLSPVAQPYAIPAEAA